MLLKLWRDRRGQDLIEYALLLALVAVAGGAMVPPVAGSVCTIFSKAISVLARFGG